MLRTTKNSANDAPRSPAKQKFCRYCYETNEPPIIYQGHYTYFSDGRALCLKMKTKGCLYCGVKGDKSHCNAECPKWRAKLSSIRRQSSVARKEQNTSTGRTKLVSNEGTTQKSNQKKDPPLRVKLLKKLLKESVMQRRRNRKRLTM